MDIKRSGPPKPVDPSQSAGPVESTKTGKFEGKLQAASGKQTPSSLSPVISELKSRFSKSDLEDSTKLDSILNYTIRELMLGQLPQALQLGESDKQVLVDFMSKEPPIQEKVMSFLRRVLD